MIGIVEDRSIYVQPSQHIKTSWIDIDLCYLGSRVRMSPEAVEKKYREILQQGECSKWPCVVGHWVDDREGRRFCVDDGRHTMLATLMLGKERIFVAWLENNN